MNSVASLESCNQSLVMESTPLVSIVTPFFNTREFLAECIESVLRQTYPNWEYILVDNCSTDGSSAIAEGYASKFPGKVRVVKTDSFLSQVQNYNFALSCISSESKYCKVVQADDWIFPDCVRAMVELAEEHPAIGVVAAYELQDDLRYVPGLPYPSHEVPGEYVCRLYFLEHLYLFGTPTSLLYRSELIRSRKYFYDERRAPFEDADVCFDLLKSWKFGFVHQILTFSRRANESILSRIEPFRFRFLSRLTTVVLHGRDYLSTKEYDRLLKEAEQEYFLFLARSAIVGKPREFWDFHRSGLASINYSLNWRLLDAWIFLAILQYLRHPRHSLTSLRGWLRKLFSGEARRSRHTLTVQSVRDEK